MLNLNYFVDIKNLKYKITKIEYKNKNTNKKLESLQLKDKM